MGSYNDFLTAQKGYRRLFVEANGSGPWPCHFCGEPVDPDEADTRRRFLVHHIDGDHSNDAIGNHAAAHWSCHGTHHGIDWWESMSADERAAWSAARSATTKAVWDRMTADERRQQVAACHAPEVRARINAANHANGSFKRNARLRGLKGGPVTAAMRFRCHGCGRVSNPGGLARHQNASGHRGRTRLD